MSTCLCLHGAACLLCAHSRPRSHQHRHLLSLLTTSGANVHRPIENKHASPHHGHGVPHTAASSSCLPPWGLCWSISAFILSRIVSKNHTNLYRGDLSAAGAQNNPSVPEGSDGLLLSLYEQGRAGRKQIQARGGKRSASALCSSISLFLYHVSVRSVFVLFVWLGFRFQNPCGES